MGKVLVTGGAGYIGSHICKKLSQRGFQPVTYDNLSRGASAHVQWGPLVVGDIRETTQLTELLKVEKPLAVIHLAAFAYVGESVEQPLAYYQNNVSGTLSLLQAMKEAQINKLVFSSTCATYGVAEKIPLNESCSQKPINPYGWSKWMVEQILKDFSHQEDFHFCSLRYFNAAGADADGDIGESHNPEPHIIPNAILAAMGKIPELAIFGNDYPTKDGTCIRDFIHVEDLAEAHILVLEKLLKNEKIENFYNLGLNKGFSLLEILQTVEKVTGKKVPYRFEKRRPGDPPELVATSEKFMRDFQWKPQYPLLENMIHSAYQWFQKQNAMTQ